MRLAFMSTILTVLMTTTLALASADDGYTLGQDGYWYYDGIPYTRQKVWYTYYSYSYGKSYPYQAYYFSYTPVSKQVTYTDPDWKSKLLEIAKGRDKIEGKLRLNAAEQKYFLEAVEALGLTGNFNFKNYGADPYGPAGVQALSINSAGYQGKTITGYSLSSVADIYSLVDRNVLYQQASRHTINAQQLAGQAASEFGTLVQQEGNNAARVAEIIAKGDAAAKALQASKAEPQTHITTREFRFQIEQTPDGKVEVKPVPEQPINVQAASIQTNFYQVAAIQCASCHAGEKPKGKFNVFSFPQMSEADKKKVRDRLEDKDPKTRMPKAHDGSPGNPLSKQQLEMFK